MNVILQAAILAAASPLLLAACSCSAPEPPPPPAADDLALDVGTIPASSRRAFEDRQPAPFILADPEWYTWGASVLREDDGTWHMFYARWPRQYTFLSWLTHSEVAHAVAERPEGPYRYVETVIRGRGGDGWDSITAHNPKIKKFDGKYYLYYIGTHGVPEDELVETARVGYNHPNWKILRPNQRTGVAWADSINGPWTRSDAPIVEPAVTITTLTVNPAVTRGPDGTYFMIVKGDKPGETRFIRNQALATAPTPTGPWTIQPRPVIDNLDTEDASMWFDRGRSRFYAVFHAHTYIGMMTSSDGYAWEKAAQPELAQKRIVFDDGTEWVPERMERPFVLDDGEGRPLMLFVACKKGDDAVNIALPLAPAR